MTALRVLPSNSLPFYNRRRYRPQQETVCQGRERRGASRASTRRPETSTARKSVVKGESVSVRVGLDGCRNIQKKYETISDLQRTILNIKHRCNTYIEKPDIIYKIE